MLVRWLDIARGIILDTDVRAIRTYTSRPVPQRYIILAEVPCACAFDLGPVIPVLL